MKKYLFFILVAFLFFGYSQSDIEKTDDIIVFYQLDYKKNVDSEKIRSEGMALIVDHEKGAIFTFEKMMHLDSIQRVRELDMADAMSNKLPTYYLISRNNDSITHYEVIGNDLLKFKESLSLNWKLINEEKNISGYTCKKAILEYAGRSWIAWYVPKIPVSQGPYKFYGLPGLIFEIYDTEKIFSFKAYEVGYGTFDRNEEGIHDLIVTNTNGESFNTNRKPKTRNFIERYKEK